MPATLSAEDLMRRAIEVARQGIAAGQSPFGCAIMASDGAVVAAHNTVLADIDSTAHAEINAIRRACRQRGDVHLDDWVVATTCEPCPMCMAALHWARVAHVYFGAAIGDAEEAGFHELTLSASDLVRWGGSPVQVTGNVLLDECRALFAEWLARPDRQAY